ncbi:MAG: hypothetical protein RXR41_03095 [Candidatus Marsarchaeota archaeon]
MGGGIKFKKAVHSISLMQYGVTYWVEKKEEEEEERAHIQGLGYFMVSSG